MEAITGAVTSVISIATECVSFLTANPVCLIFLAGSVVGIGFGIFRRAKRSAK